MAKEYTIKSGNDVCADIVWHQHKISKSQRASIKTQKPCLLWFTGLSGAGKSTIANAVEAQLFDLQRHTYLLDGDNVRYGLNKDLGFSDESRVENIRRIGEVAKLFVDSGMIVLSAFISPFREDRKMVRQMLEPGEFVEVHVSTPLNVCEHRDPKGLYKKARAGRLEKFTGVDSPYEPPVNPELTLNTDAVSLSECVERVIGYLIAQQFIVERDATLYRAS
ncbi:adenylyl-sulfate kinase [Hahella sp. HN01]|uniref:adenylyl-sulfate kinase n=1 Tax=Hahella sp. HN01 TaxID=2847262 RepID=UPI001C1EDB80|nr:adenylyl-sulfate kinase [Hahella sp. HN01]